jgi:hypothetical protein
MIQVPGAHRTQLLVGEIVDGSGAQLERCLNFGGEREPDPDIAPRLHTELWEENPTFDIGHE